MQLTLDKNQGNYQIQSYTPGCLTINHQAYTSSVILTAHELDASWPPQHFSELKSEHVELLLPRKPTIILLGTGSTLQFPPAKLLAPLYQQGIGVEVMHTLAACRTFTILSAEGRNVLAALIID